MILAVGISHARSFKYVYGDVTFKCNEDRGAITITSFDDDADVVVIPGSIDGVPVRKVSCFINGHNYMASELVIEEGVEEIAKFCFNEFRQLRKVTLPSTLIRVNSNAFRKGNDIIFYGPENFDVALVKNYTSRPFSYDNSGSGVDRLMLAQNDTEKGKKNDKVDKKEIKVQKERQREAEDLDIAIAKRKAELNKLNKENEERELEKKRQELLALEESAKAAKKQNKETGRKKGGMFSKFTNMFGGGDNSGSVDNRDKLEEQPSEPLVAQALPAPATESTPKTRKFSDVDVNIPQSQKVNEATFCFIIANEEYDELPTVNYANNDGNTFKEYCINALGVPESQVFLYTNASYTSMTRALRKMESLAAATNGKSKFVFYYAGHGSPSEEDQTAFIVPSDGLVTVPSTCFSLGDIYKRFGEMPAESVVVLLDACFSGLNRDNSGLIAARAVARKPKKETVTGNVIVLSATSEAETAMGYDEKGHGMFTYHVLKTLQQSNGEIKFGELFQSVSEGVRKDSIIKNDKNQTPSLAVSSSLKNSWEGLGF
ncbi:MAG: hypothetical protein HDR97_07460 [Bacteroides sp.]|nr:hypothetical protein [Bacteroides sp.]MBD5333558.1 hypothetical protein [Bacteroides sp.]